MAWPLSPITREQHKIEYAVGDIETMNWTKFIVLGIYDGKNFYEFKCRKKFFEWLKTAKIPKTIFFHFGGKFDFMFLLETILENPKIKIIDIIPRGSSLLCFRIEVAGHVFDFRDSSALLPFSLKSITENFGTDVKKKEWDHSKTKGYSKELSEYLKADCVSLHQSLEKFYNWPLINRAGPATTIASQAVKVLRTFLKKDLRAPSREANEFARQAYLGGRTEIFRLQCTDGPLYEYDVNSLYPFVMRENFFPTGRPVFTYDFEKDKLGIYEAEVTAPDIHIPALGVLANNKYLFPVGKFKGHWTSVELDYAKSLGYKIKIKYGLYFEEKEKLFTDYVDSLYEIKSMSAQNSVNYVIAKLLMNSGYGRFGMNLDRENLTFNLVEGGDIYKTMRIGNENVTLFKTPVTLDTFTHVAIAAFVTSYARIHMHKILNKYPQDVFYTDTDSIFTTRQLKTGKALGELKLEGTYDSAVFLLPKTYIAKAFNKKKVAMKGFDKKKIQDFDIFDFKNALEGDLKRFKITNEPKFATLKQALSQNKIVSLTKKSEKQLKAVYDKRIVIKDSKNQFKTKPITL